MAWRIEWDERAVRDARKLDSQARKRIIDYLRKRIATDQSPHRFGKPLLVDKSGLWRYRVGDYRIVCRIEVEKVVVLVLAVGHRSTVHEGKVGRSRHPRTPSWVMKEAASTAAASRSTRDK